jgi:flagellar hook-associated protein 1 FlgK
MQVAAGAGQSIASFQDTQDQLVASLSAQLPVQVLQNGNNNIIVTTDGGTTLFDGVANHLSFTATPNIAASEPASSLSQVTVGGPTGTAIAISQNGSIAANLQLRDVTLPGYSNQLDQVAGNLITLYQSADPTVSAYPTAHSATSGTPAAGLFTNAGYSLPSTASTTGLAGTISVNTNVVADPGLVQSGVYGTPSSSASYSSTAGNNSTILAFVDALTTSATNPTPISPATTNPGTSYSATGLPTTSTVTNAAAQLAGFQQDTMTTWTNLNTTRGAQATSAASTLTGVTGVSVDDQLQRLMIVQQTYAASAQVIQAASNMLNNLISVIQ